MASSFEDVQALVTDASCLSCLNDNQLSAVQAYLLTQIMGGGMPVGPHDLLSLIHPDTLPGSPTRGALVVGNATPVWAALTLGAANQVLRTNGTDALWAKVALGTDVSGQLPLANGGTNNNITADAGAVVYSTAVALALTLPGLSGQLLQSNGIAAPDWTTSTYPTAAGSAGTILISDGTNWIVSTTTYPNTVAINSLLYASAANTVTGLAPSNSSVLGSSATGVPTWLGPMTNGQLIIGSTGATPVAASLTAGANIVITPGAGSITIATTGLVGTHTVLDGTVHTDTVAQTVTRGSIIVGNSTPLWDELTLGGSGTVLRSNGTDLVYSTFTIPDTYTTGDIIYASAANVFSALADVSAGSYLRSGGVATAPLWSTVKIPNTATTGDLWQGTAANTITALASVAAGSYLRSGGVATASVWSTLTLPNASSQGDLFYSTAANAMIVLTKDTNATRYLSNTGTNNDPLWALVNLTNGVTGDLPFANMVQIATNKVLGRTTAGTGDIEVLGRISLQGTGTGVVNIGQLGDNSNFSGIAIGTAAAAISAGNYSILGDGTDTRLSAPGGTVYHMISNNGVMAMTSTGLFIGGVTAPSFLLHVATTRTTAGTMSAFQLTYTPAGNEAATATIGTAYTITKTGASNVTVAIGGVRGLSFSCGNTGTGAITELVGSLASIFNSGSGTITRAMSYYANSPSITGAGTPITTLYGYYAAAQTATGVTTAYGFYAAGTSDFNYFGGRVGIGQTSPSARLHLPAGTTTAGTGPLLFSTGTSLTVAVAGMMEYTTDDLFFTIATGTARKRLLMADPVGGLTSGRVPFATTNGRLTDDADLTFDGTVLTTLQLSVGTGKISTYNGIATEGYGVPAIVDDIALTGQVANIASTNFTNAGTVGTYRVSCYMVCTTADAAAGTITLNIAHNDGTAARTLIGALVPLTATNASTTISFVLLGSGSISYSVTIAGAYMTAVYSLYVTVERLS